MLALTPRTSASRVLRACWRFSSASTFMFIVPRMTRHVRKFFRLLCARTPVHNDADPHQGRCFCIFVFVESRCNARVSEVAHAFSCCSLLYVSWRGGTGRTYDAARWRAGRVRKTSFSCMPRFVYIPWYFIQASRAHFAHIEAHPAPKRGCRKARHKPDPCASSEIPLSLFCACAQQSQLAHFILDVPRGLQSGAARSA